jgi:predicted Holliday junction resolvase-like endonuclease
VIADWVAGAAMWLMNGLILLLIVLVVLLLGWMAAIGCVRRLRVRRAQRRVRAAWERAAAERVVVPGQRTGER